MMARWTVGACAMFCGMWVGPRCGLPVLARSSAWTSMPVVVSFKHSRRHNEQTFLQKNPLQQRVLIPQHQTFISSTSMRGLQVMQVRLMHANSILELLDILCSALSERSLSLSVSLLALFRRGVYLLPLAPNSHTTTSNIQVSFPPSSFAVLDSPGYRRSLLLVSERRCPWSPLSLRGAPPSCPLTCCRPFP